MTHYYFTPAEICSGGADKVKVIANQIPVEELRAGLEYARRHPGCSKTLVTTLEREIRRKEQAAGSDRCGVPADGGPAGSDFAVLHAGAGERYPRGGGGDVMRDSNLHQLANGKWIDITYETEADYAVRKAGCPRCGTDSIFALIDPSEINKLSWHCMICGKEWISERGLPAFMPKQMEMEMRNGNA